jgi:hypothetical protein
MDIEPWSWGWGAASIDVPEDKWICPECGWKARLRKDGSAARGRHWYLFGGVRCTACALRFFNEVSAASTQHDARSGRSRV